MDIMKPKERSERMARIRSRGNQTTELSAISALRKRGIRGWRRHVRRLPGTPDFYFRTERVAVFVDGCFWHGCPQCYRAPTTRAAYWKAKVVGNRERDARNRRELRKRGVATLAVWEHELRKMDTHWLTRLAFLLRSRAAMRETSSGR